MTVDNLFEFRSVSDPQISPEGLSVVYVVSLADFENAHWDTDLWLVRWEAGKPADGWGAPRQLTFTTARDTRPRWSPDGQSIAFLRGSGTSAQIWLLALAGGEPRAVTHAARGISSFQWAPDGKAIFYLAASPPQVAAPQPANARPQPRVESDDGPFTHLWRLDLSTLKTEQLTTGALELEEFAVSPDGEKIAFSATPDPAPLAAAQRSEIFLLNSILRPSPGAAAPWRLTQNGWGESGFSWRPDSSGFLFLAEADAKFEFFIQQQSAFFFDLASGKVQAVRLDTGPAAEFNGTVEQVEWFSAGEILAVVSEGVCASLRLVRFASGDSRSLTHCPAVAGSISLSDNRLRNIALLEQSPAEPARLGVISSVADLHAGQVFRRRNIASHNAMANELALARFQVVRWQASDGVEVEGILYKPEGKGPWPLVTMIHGGPASAEQAGFLATWGRYPHVLAAMGAASFLPNYRGSTGYGAAFHQRSVGDRNGRDAQDIEEGIDALIARGVADAKRLALMGWSAGGVLTNWLVANHPRYRAASSGAGVSDWTFQYFLSDYAYGSNYYFRGTPWEQREKYWEKSPLRIAVAVKTPVLLHWGANDERVPLPHGRAWYRALRANGVPVRFVVYPGEGHTLAQPAHQKRKLEEDLAWFRKYLLGP